MGAYIDVDRYGIIIDHHHRASSISCASHEERHASEQTNLNTRGCEQRP